jgi:hypothetical protein
MRHRRNVYGVLIMASATRPRVKAFIPAKKKPSALLVDARAARKELLDDLMGDAKKCLSTKNKAEQKAFFLAVRKIAAS